MRRIIMRAQRIPAKVPIQKPHHRVHMIRVILRVIVFDQKLRPLNPVILPLPLLKRPAPRKVNLIRPRRHDLLVMNIRRRLMIPQHILLNQLLQRPPLLLIQLRHRNPLRLQMPRLPIRPRNNIRRRRIRINRHLLLRVTHRPHQLQSQILLPRKNPQPRPRPRPNLIRIRPIKRRRPRLQLIPRHREIKRQMMPLPPPPPRIRSRLPKNAHKIRRRIPRRPPPLLRLQKNLLQTNNRRRLQKPPLTQRRIQQPKRQRLLRRVHFLQRQPLPLLRDEMPIKPLIAPPLELRLRCLLRLQRIQKPLRRRRNIRRNTRRQNRLRRQTNRRRQRKNSELHAPDFPANPPPLAIKFPRRVRIPPAA